MSPKERRDASSSDLRGLTCPTHLQGDESAALYTFWLDKAELFLKGSVKHNLPLRAQHLSVEICRYKHPPAG